MVRALTAHEIKRRDFLLRNDNILKYLYPDLKSVYGPYLGKDNRYRVVFYDGIKRQTRQYCKVKMEIKLERRIEEPETVDHFNNNTKDDRYSNLRVLLRGVHVADDVLRAEKIQMTCVWCDNTFTSRVRGRNRGKAGPFCSRICSGSYGAALQNKKTNKLKKVNYKQTYYRNKSNA